MATANQTTTNFNDTIRRRVEFFELFYKNTDGERESLDFEFIKEILKEIAVFKKNTDFINMVL